MGSAAVAQIGAVRRTEDRDAALADIESLAREWLRSLEASERVEDRLTDALRAGQTLGIGDQRMADAMMRAIPPSTYVGTRRVPSSIMAVRRRLGKARPK